MIEAHSKASPSCDVPWLDKESDNEFHFNRGYLDELPPEMGHHHFFGLSHCHCLGRVIAKGQGLLL